MKAGRYRWGFDLGTNSIGWCVLRLDEKGEPIGSQSSGHCRRGFSRWESAAQAATAANIVNDVAEHRL